MNRYEVGLGEYGDSYIVIDLRRPCNDRTIAEFYGDLKDALRNAEAFCFMKNMWQNAWQRRKAWIRSICNSQRRSNRLTSPRSVVNLQKRRKR